MTRGNFIRLVDRELERDDPRYYLVKFCGPVRGKTELFTVMDILLLTLPRVTPGTVWEIPSHVVEAMDREAIFDSKVRIEPAAPGARWGYSYRGIPIVVVEGVTGVLVV